MSEHPRKPLPRDELLRRRQQAEGFLQHKQIAGEERQVLFLLNRLGMPRQKWRLLRTAEARTGQKRLTLDLFNEAFPSFPLLLAYSQEAGERLHQKKDATLPALFTRFQSFPPVKFYEDWFERVERDANGRAIGLLFPRKGIQRGLILHNGEGLEGLWLHGMVATYTGGNRKHPYRLYLQAFAPLVEAIHNKGHGWKPETVD